MKKNIKRIISIVLCIALVMGLENMTAYREIFTKIGSNVITWAASRNENEETEDKENVTTDLEITSDYVETESDESLTQENSESEESITEANESEVSSYEEESDTTSEETTKVKKSKSSSTKKNSKKSSKSTAKEETDSTQEETTEETVQTEETTAQEPDYGTEQQELAGAAGDVAVHDATTLESGKTYIIESYLDWNALVEKSQSSTLEGVTFFIRKNKNNTGKWEINTTNVPNLGKYGAIGNDEKYPFSGTIEPFYSGLDIYSDTVLFKYLSSKAKIGNKARSFRIYYKKNVPCALANNLILDTDGCEVNIGGDNSNYSIQLLGGTINTTGIAGGLFQQICIGGTATESGTHTLNIYGSSIQIVTKDSNGNFLSGINTVTGKIAGGLAGKITGNIKINVNSISNLPENIVATGNTLPESGGGGLVGMIDGGVEMTFTNTEQISLDANITTTSGNGLASGGLVGYMENASLICDTDAGILRTGNTYAKGYAGGLVGYAKNSSVTVRNFTLKRKNENTTGSTPNNANDLYIKQTGTGVGYSAGGVIGVYDVDSSVSGKKLDISEIKTTNKNVAECSNIYIVAASSTNCKRGGIAGLISSGDAEVKIHDINTETTMSGDGGDNTFIVGMSFGGTTSYGVNTVTGGLSGVVSGTNITIDNVVFNYRRVSSSYGCMSNGLNGSDVGSVAGATGYNMSGDPAQTKIIVKDVKVMNLYTRYVESKDGTNGGLFGNVKNSVIALQGDIDLSGVPCRTISSSYWYNDLDREVLLGSYGRRGFIAGYVEQSLIYRDVDCNYIAPIEYDSENNNYKYKVRNSTTIEDASFSPDALGKSNDYTVDRTNAYCIDDIGNAGSVFINSTYIDESGNSEKVLDISKDYSSIVNGTVSTETVGEETYYVLDSIQDALRFAVAGNSVNSSGNPEFGAGCFKTSDDTADPTLSTILKRNFEVRTDLNLSDAGIHGFVNNAYVKYAFTGKFVGASKDDGTKYKITLDFISKQRYGGLFPYANGATFSNIEVCGNLWYLQGSNVGNGTISGNHSQAAAGSLAAYASGDITVDNVVISTSMKTMTTNNTTWDNDRMWCYGGMFGIYNQVTNTFTCRNSTIAPKFTSVMSSTFVGGMVGWIYETKEFTATTDKLYNITVESCTISTKITTNEYFGFTGNHNVHGRSAGLVALISKDYTDVVSTGNYYSKPATVENQTRAKIKIYNVTIDDADINASSCYANTKCLTIGGTLGYAWTYTDADISYLIVENTEITSRGVVGGLISFAAGRFNFDNVNIDSLKMISEDEYTGCGFLIGNGQNALVNISNYTISTEKADDGTAKVSATSYISFDEIVGLTLRLREGEYGTENIYASKPTVDKQYKDGGIVNIIDSNFTDFSKSYKSYENQVVTTTNKYTRYYYNLFTTGTTAETALTIMNSDNVEDSAWTVVVSGNTATINDEKEFMTYSVAAYANTYIQRFFNPFLSGIECKKINSVNVINDIDLNGYSYYPIAQDRSVTYEFNSHTVKLYAKDVYELEKAIAETGCKIDRNNEITDSQHYLMHAALFMNITTATTINNITLTGTVANLGENTGGLIAGSITGTGHNINNVVLNNLTVHNYKTGDYCGLMIGKVGVNCFGRDVATLINITGVDTTGYTTTTTNDDESTTQTYGSPVASSLICIVGSDDATDVKIYFKDIVVEDERTTPGADNVGKLFEYASYIYDYEYTTDIAQSKCYISYMFTKDEADKETVTYGDEIRAGVQYADQDRISGDVLDNAIQAAKKDTYIPYVYKSRDIYVNPRNGDITVGCGTYEDPYIISNAKQFLTLYLYLTYKDEYTTIFNGSTATDTTTSESESTSGKWKVVPVGGTSADHSACEGKTDESEHKSATFGDTDFPTREQLSTAYYKITKDINLAADSSYDMNDKQISEEFCGLGTEDRPFAGVIIGTETSGDGSTIDGRYTITLPKQKVVNNTQLTQAYFGLIQYMSGAVVKDLNIEAAGYDSEESAKEHYNFTTAAGGVAARVVGGDNIIDNVYVSINFNTGTSGIEAVGGLVGTVDAGTLILRKYQGGTGSENSAYPVGNCTFENYNGMNNTGTVDGKEYKGTIDSNKNFTKGTVTDNGSVLCGTYNGVYGDKVGLLVGMAYDGCVIYEDYSGQTATEPYIITTADQLNVSNNRYTVMYPLVNGSHIVNANRLESDSMKYTYDSTTKKYNVTVKDTEGLELLAMALNSDSLSVLYDSGDRTVKIEDYGYETAYGYYSRCRKAKYDNVGCGSSADEDRNLAVNYDDNKSSDIGYLYPYLCSNFMDYTDLADTSEAYGDDDEAKNYAGYKKTLSSVNVDFSETKGTTAYEYTRGVIAGNTNKMISAVADYETTYNLEGTNKTFELSEYDLSFKGIGEVYTDEWSGKHSDYTVTNSDMLCVGGDYFVGFSDFRGNFNGNGNSVKFVINRVYDDGIMYSGMFNKLTYNKKLVNTNDTNQFEIKDFTIQNSVVYNPNKSDVTVNWNYMNTYGINLASTGMLAGVMQGAWKVDNVDISKTENTSIRIKSADVTVISNKMKKTDDSANNETHDVSGYKSVGGYIGRINNTHNVPEAVTSDNLEEYSCKSNDIDIVDCDVNGSKSVAFNVQELGSTSQIFHIDYWKCRYYYVYAGGIVGSIGTNIAPGANWHTRLYGDVDIKGTNISYLDVTALGVGHIGGISGSIGNRCYEMSYTSTSNSGNWVAGYASLGNVSVDGLGSDNKSSKIQHVNVESETTNQESSYSAGGMFGVIQSPHASIDSKNYTGNVEIKNYTLYAINVDTKYNALSQEYTNKSYSWGDTYLRGAGGVVGYSRCYCLKINKVVIEKSSIGNDKLLKYSGGFIGRADATRNTHNDWVKQYYVDCSIDISNCKADTIEVTSMGAPSGGLIGLDAVEKTYINMNMEEDGSITCDTNANTIVQNSIIKNAGIYGGTGVGGVIGSIICEGANSAFEYYLNNVDVIDTTVENNYESAGGVVGLSNINWNNAGNKITLNNIYVYSSGETKTTPTTITASHSAGGVIGRIKRDGNSHYINISMTGNIGVGQQYNTTESAWNTETSQGVNIKGKNAGGLVGYQNSCYGMNNPADIMVANNRIYSFYNENESNPGTYSGGLYGYLHNEGTTTFYKTTVKNNVIFTGVSTATTINKTASACGGLIGYAYQNVTDANIYMPYVTLENNSIGYYNVDSDVRSGDAWKSVALNSADITLYEISGSYVKAVKWNEISNLSDDTIGLYAVSFGQFVGVYAEKLRASAMYILSPSVTVDKEEVGSIPVVDVGNWSGTTSKQSELTYQCKSDSSKTGYPYVYKDYVHIVYDKAVKGSTSDTESQYTFEEFETYVSSYKSIINSTESDLTTKNYNYITSENLNMYLEYSTEKISLCTGDTNYYAKTYTHNESYNGAAVLVLDGLKAQNVGDYAAAILTNAGGVTSPETVKDMMEANKKTLDNFWKIECVNAYIDSGGNIVCMDDSGADTAVKAAHSTASIENVSGYSNQLKLKENPSVYDEVLTDSKDSKVYTITLLRYTYTCKNAAGDDKTMTIEIPVFVKEKVTVDSYLRILSGEEYSKTTAASSGYKDNVAIASDSVYTIYMEFIYDKIRLKDSFADDYIDKGLHFDTTATIVQEGTKFTLIDCSTGKAYYYEATGNEAETTGKGNKIMFTDFVDSSGNKYNNRRIGKTGKTDGASYITEELSTSSHTSPGWTANNKTNNGQFTYKDDEATYGVESFMIVVEPPENELNAIAPLELVMDAKGVNDEDVDEFFNKNVKSSTTDSSGNKIQLTYLPAPKVTLATESDSSGNIEMIVEKGVTYIEGSLSEDKTVDVDAQIEVSVADGSPYWEENAQGNVIDSSNHDKYIEASVTLVDGNGNVVAWPSGTNVSINGGEKQLLKNNLIVYSYKDLEKTFPMNGVNYDLKGECYYYSVTDTQKYWIYPEVDKDGNATGRYYYYESYDTSGASGTWKMGYIEAGDFSEDKIDITNQLHFSFDFSTANIDEYVESEGDYRVQIKLYRSDSPEYPNEGDSKSNGSSIREYIKEIDKESKKDIAAAVAADNLKELGINTYNPDDESYKISFTNKLDFTDVIGKNSSEEKVTQRAGVYASKKYMVTYRIYKKLTGQPTTNTSSLINSKIGSEISRGSGCYYKLLSWNDADLPFTLYGSNEEKLTGKEIEVNSDTSTGTSEKQCVIVTDKEFTVDEIIKGSASGTQKQTKYVVTWGMKLEVDKDKLKNDDLTNYMITVTYVPYDATATDEDGKEIKNAQPENDQNQTLYDYFIFTVAKLKTDM